jgi:hypothetical protein
MRLIYVDSKFRSSGSTTDFKVALRETIHVADGSLMRVDQIRFPVEFYTVSARNKYVYLINWTNGLCMIPLELGNFSGYELAAHLRQRCTDTTGGGGSWQAAYNASTGSMTITSVDTVTWLTDAQVRSLPNGTFGANWSAADIDSFADNLGESPIMSGRTATFQFVSVAPVDTLYLCSRILSSPDCYGPRHNHDVLAKIVLNNESLGQIHKTDMPYNLYHTLRECTLREIDFQLTDRQGFPVDLPRGEISFVVSIS